MKRIFLMLLAVAGAFHTFAQTYDSRIFGDIKARQIGPAVMSGRVACVDAVNAKPQTVYIGGADGGVWKSLDGGVTFKSVFDKYFQSVGAIAIDQKHPDTVWVGTGESWTRNSVSMGNGIYVTYDGGSNWKKMGLDSSERIAQIRINPNNSNIVCVAVPGHLFNDDSHRGVYITNDGGKTWQRSLYVDAKTGCADLAMDPSNPNILYAAMWQFRRTPYSFTSGGPGSGLYKSEDGGKTWRKLTNGIPNEPLGRIAVIVSPANPKIVYATIEYSKSAMFRSNDKGEHWKRTGTDLAIVERSFYFARLVADPKDSNVVFRGGLNMVDTKDGGQSFTNVGGGAHGDYHDVWIDPNNTFHLYITTDGGVYVSNDRGAHTIAVRSLPLSQYYHVWYDMRTPYNVYGGLQDNNSWVGPSRTNVGGILSKYWFPVSGGDGFWCMPDQSDDRYIYSESQGGSISRFDRDLKTAKDIQPLPRQNEPKYRFNWNTPIAVSPNNQHKIYIGAQFLFTSYDKGETWKKISTDLTTNNPAELNQSASGGITNDNSSAENHCAIYSIAESPLDSNTIWAGTDDGNVQLTRDDGKTWNNLVANLIAKGVPKEAWVSTIEPSHNDKATAYVTIDNHMFGDVKPYVYKTADYGQTWTQISNDSIKGYCFSVREDLVNPNLLFVGTEFGLFVSLDAGQQWAQLNYNNNIPDVAIRDMIEHPRDHDLILATHGRGVFIIDGDQIDLLRQITPAVLQQKMFVYKPKTFVIPVNGFDAGAAGDDDYVGANPSNQPQIAYYLQSKQLIGDFKIDVLDQNGNLVQSYPAGKHKGINIVDVPLQMKPPKVPPAPQIAGGAFATPDLGEGSWKIRLIKNKDTVVTSITEVRADNAPYTADDRVARHQAMMHLYDVMNNFAYTVDCITKMHDAAVENAAKLPANDKLKIQLNTFANYLDTLHKHVVTLTPGAIVDENAGLRNQLANLFGTIAGYDGRPNNSALDRSKVLEGQVNETESTYQKIMDQYLTKINTALQSKKLPALQRETRADFDKNSS